MILELVREYGPAGREDIDKLLMNKLPEILTEGQKKAKIHNLISELSRSLCVIRNIGSRRYPKWVLSGKNSRYEQARLKNNKTDSKIKESFLILNSCVYCLVRDIWWSRVLLKELSTNCKQLILQISINNIEMMQNSVTPLIC
ncbi:hypothetical protein KKC04_04770 [Patescibacteria group bacterium]|nr:hypothetical protein [Patescibacteria group bacterium]